MLFLEIFLITVSGGPLHILIAESRKVLSSVAVSSVALSVMEMLVQRDVFGFVLVKFNVQNADVQRLASMH